MAQATQFNVDNGTEIIDINMGCPAKKVCNTKAGSALLQNEKLVEKILMSVVTAVDVPVTLKIRTGWDMKHRNGLTIAKIAESCGVKALTVHGRTRACGFKGKAEYNTIREIKSQITIPVIANGDITSATQAAQVIQFTNADGIMIGRAAQGNPWIFREISHYLATGRLLVQPTDDEIFCVLVKHLNDLYDFYGEYKGVRIARKHIGLYSKHLHDGRSCRALINQAESAGEQLRIVGQLFTGRVK